MKRVLTFGEAMLRFSPPGHARLEQATSLDLNVGGAELNVAAGLACLGVPAEFFTALPDNPLGRLALAEVRRSGVDGRRIRMAEKGRMGAYYVEFGASPRPSRVVYDRGGSALSLLDPGDVDWRLLFKGLGHFHTTGITTALSPNCLKLTAEALALAKEKGVSTSFDLNYRARLWSEQKARRSLTPLMGMVDHLVTTEEDTWRVFRIKGDTYEEVVKRLVDKFGLLSAAITLREDLSVLRNRWTSIAWDGYTFYADRSYDVDVVDRVGSGDAFTAGYIYGVLSDDLALGLKVGNAMAAIKHSVPGDLLRCNRQEALDLAMSEEQSTRIQR